MSETTINEQEFFKIGISVNGVKKRCRKVERHFLSLGYVPYNDGVFNQEELENKARDFVSENMKTVQGKYEVVLNYVKRKKDSYGTIETWEMFGKKNLRFIVQSQLINELA
jgi:hypothetical protein